jgi:inosine/xanthosine triphosphatase
MKIAVGSTNPVKLAAVRSVLAPLFPQADFIPVGVCSGVTVQPWGDDQTRTGALNRARNACAKLNATYGVGLEGGLDRTPAGIMTCAWCAIVNGTGAIGFGGGVKMLLPPAVVHHLEETGELGPAIDALVNQHNTKLGQGAVGILTNGLTSRQSAYEQLVAMAMAPFVTDYYSDD